MRFIGDNFYERGIDDESDPLFDNSFSHVYIGRSLDVPWWATLGNHDYHSNSSAQLTGGGGDGVARRDARWNMPSRSYKKNLVSSPKVDLFVVDTTPWIREARGELFNRLRCLKEGGDLRNDEDIRDDDVCPCEYFEPGEPEDCDKVRG